MVALDSTVLKNGALEFTALAAGPASGTPVICLHGFPDNAHSFRYLLPALADAGYRALAPTMRGYEPSSQPADGDYSMAALVGDLVAWIDGLGAGKVHLVGHDWGAVVAYLAGALFPDRFLTVTVMAVPHSARFAEGIKEVPGQLLNSWYMIFFQLRGIADWAVARNDWALIKKLWRDWSPGYALGEDEWACLRETFEGAGVKKAMLAYYRQNASPTVLLGLRKPETPPPTVIPVPTLAVTGADDGCIDTRLFNLVMLEEDFPKGLRIERIARAGHFAHVEKPDEINRLILDWIEGAGG